MGINSKDGLMLLMKVLAMIIYITPQKNILIKNKYLDYEINTKKKIKMKSRPIKSYIQQNNL